MHLPNRLPTLPPRSAGRHAVAIALALVALPGVLSARQQASVADSLDALARAEVEDGFSGQVLVARDGEVLLHRGYGPADPATGAPVDTATVFAVGSVTKRFTRAAVLALEERGLLSTSDPVSRFLEGLPPDKRSLTIRQLLDHEAGLHEYHDDSGDHQAMSRAEAIRRIGSQELRFEPGTDRAYSNSGYTLLAAVVEEASGRPFEDFVRDAILDPAGMERTGFHGEERWPDRRVARGHGMRRHGDNAPHTWPATTWALKGAGGMVGPASDLLRFVRSLRAGELLGPAGTADLLPDDRPHLVYAGGDDFGFVTLVMELDHGRHVVIVQTNSGHRVDALGRSLAAAVRGEPLPGTRRVEARSDADGPGGPGGDGAAPAGRSDVPESPRARAAGWLIAALEDGSPEALRTLVEERFAPALRDAFPMEAHLEMLGRLSSALREAGVRGMRPVAELSVAVVLGDESRLVLDLAVDPPHRIEGVRVEGGRDAA